MKRFVCGTKEPCPSAQRELMFNIDTPLFIHYKVHMHLTKKIAWLWIVCAISACQAFPISNRNANQYPRTDSHQYTATYPHTIADHGAGRSH
jgi:hypothetical protein